MGWTTPTTVSVGTVGTAAVWNASVRDNELYLYQRPAAKIALDANQSINDSTVTALVFAQAYTFNNTGPVVFAARGGTSTSLIVPEAGIYQITGCVRFAANATGIREGFITINGTLQDAGFDISATSGGVEPTITPLSDLLSLAASDAIGIKVLHTKGSALNVETGSTFIAAVRVA